MHGIAAKTSPPLTLLIRIPAAEVRIVSCPRPSHLSARQRSLCNSAKPRAYLQTLADAVTDRPDWQTDAGLLSRRLRAVPI